MTCLKALIIIGILAFFSQAKSSIICGYVVDLETGREIVNAKIILENTSFSKKTDVNGYFEFSDIPAATYKIVVTHYNHKQTVLEGLNVGISERIKLNIEMVRKKIVQKSDEVYYSTSRTNSTRKDPASPEKKAMRKEIRSAPEAGTISVERETNIKMGHPPVMEMETMDVRKPAAPAAKSGLRAGYADDNQQFNYFINFLTKFKKTPHYPLNISERIRLSVQDRDGKSVPNALIEIREKSQLLTQGRTFADGSFYIFPQDIDLKGEQIQVLVKEKGQPKSILLERSGLRDISVKLSETRNVKKSIPLDLLFILDATGSMGEEIARLKSTIEIINLNLSSLNIKPALRFGLVAYRDREDDYVTRLIPFTADLDRFRLQLKNIQADGGGDTPEDLQSALSDALHKMEWNPDGIRLAFIITDAGLHMDYGQKFTYADAARLAKKRAIKIFTVGTGGLDITGEYVLRQISQYTSGKYIFLTYGERGESEGGKPGSVSHHTGSNFNAENLESIIIRFAKEELAQVSDMTISEETPWFEANAIDDESRHETLKKLFQKSIQELVDYSSLSLQLKTTIAALPFEYSFESQANNAEYFYEQLILALSKTELFRMTERKDLQQITREIGLKLSGLTENDQAAKVGEFIGAEMLINGKLYFKDNRYEIFLKLLRVETAEVLSITRVRIDPKLGL